MALHVRCRAVGDEEARHATPYDQDNVELVTDGWETADTVLSFDGYMNICWADYHRGIVFCDVLSPDPELSFVRFPGISMW